MTRDEIRGLMGGYATGSLSDAERKILFDAALEDQELFDDLAREQALKEVLDEPGAKQRLIAALSQHAPEPNRSSWWSRSSWWKTPWVWAAAGAGALAVIVGLVLMQPTPKQLTEQVARVETPVAPAIVPPAMAPKTEAAPPPTPAAPQALRDEFATRRREFASAPSVAAPQAATPEEPALSKLEKADTSAPTPPAPASPPPPPAPRAQAPPPPSPTTVGGLTPVPPSTVERVPIAPEQVPVLPEQQLAEGFVVNGTVSLPAVAAGAGGAAAGGGGGGRGGGGGGRGGRAGGGAGANKTAAPQPAADAVAETRSANAPLGFAGAGRALSAPRFAFDYSVSPQGSLRIVPAANGFLTVGVSNGTATSLVFSNRAVQAGVATETSLPADSISANAIFSAQNTGANAVTFVKSPMDPPSGTLSDPNPSPTSRLSAVFPVKR